MSDMDMNQMQNTAEDREAGTADIINEETAGAMGGQTVKEDMPEAGQNGPSYANQNANAFQYGSADPNACQYANNYQYTNNYQYANNCQNPASWQNPNAFRQGGSGAPNNTYPNANAYGSGNAFGGPNGQNGYPYGGTFQESPYQGAPIAPISQEAPEPPMKVSDWVLTLLVLSVPCLNIVMLFVWGFGTAENRSKANFCKAALIWTAAAAALGFILYMVIVAGIIAGLG